MKRKKCGETERGQSMFGKRKKVERNRKGQGMRTRKKRRQGDINISNLVYGVQYTP